MIFYQSAWTYLQNGMSVIPICSPSIPGHSKEKCEKSFCKHPLVSWTNNQKRLPTEAELKRWDAQWPGANLAVICGEISGNLIALDVEAGKETLFEGWLKENQITLPEETVRYRTGGGGFHIWFKTSSLVKKRKTAWGDIQAEGSYVVVPPSIHQSGVSYMAMNSKLEVAMAPLELERLLTAPSPGGEEKFHATRHELLDDLKNLEEGKRVDTLVREAGRLIALGHEPEEANLILWGLNLQATLPLSRKDFDIEVGQAAPRFHEKKTSGAFSPEECIQFSGLSEITGSNDSLLETSLRQLSDLISKADPVCRSLVRERAITLLRDKKVASPAKLLDAAFSVIPRQVDRDDNLQGQSIHFQEPEPWPDLVNGAELLDELTGFIGRFVVTGEHERSACALWVIHTWFVDALDFSPILAISSPEKRCGKSTLLRVLSEVAQKPFRAASSSTASIFRLIEKERPTVLLDELDTFFDENEELRGLLNEGVEPSGTFLRTVGDEHEPRAFRVFCPKALSLIGKLPGTVEDRAIPIMMKRKSTGERVERFQKKKVSPLAQELCRKLARFAADNLAALRDSDPATPESLNDRQADCWRPLLAIADIAGGDWPQKAREAALALGGEKAGEEGSVRVELLRDIRNFFQGKDEEKFFTDTLLEHLNSLEERPWPEFNRGEPMTARQLARLLKPFGINSSQFRIGGTSKKGYSLEDLQDAFSRYIPASDPKQAKQTNTDAGFGDFSEAKQTGNVSDEKTEENPREIKRVSDVSDKNHESRDKGGSEGEVPCNGRPIYQFDFPSRPSKTEVQELSPKLSYQEFYRKWLKESESWSHSP